MADEGRQADPPAARMHRRLAVAHRRPARSSPVRRGRPRSWSRWPSPSAAAPAPPTIRYACPMHAEVRSPSPGRVPDLPHGAGTRRLRPRRRQALPRGRRHRRPARDRQRQEAQHRRFRPPAFAAARAARAAGPRLGRRRRKPLGDLLQRSDRGAGARRAGHVCPRRRTRRHRRGAPDRGRAGGDGSLDVAHPFPDGEGDGPAGRRAGRGGWRRRRARGRWSASRPRRCCNRRRARTCSPGPGTTTPSPSVRSTSARPSSSTGSRWCCRACNPTNA